MFHPPGSDQLIASDEFARYDWFHGRCAALTSASAGSFRCSIDRDTSAAIVLQYGSSGSYIIRKSGTVEGYYVLTLNWCGVAAFPAR